MFRKVAAVVLAVSIVPAAAFACAQHHAQQSSATKDQKVMLAQADATKKDMAKATAQTGSTAQTAATSKKLKPKAKTLSQPKAVTTTTTGTTK